MRYAHEAGRPELNEVQIEVRFWLTLSTDELAIINDDVAHAYDPAAEDADETVIAEWVADTVDIELQNRLRCRDLDTEQETNRG